jgi:hypothetical protein
MPAAPSAINFATLFLVDAVTSALAFDVPELMDTEHAWLNEMMRQRAVPTELLAKHLDTFVRVLRQSFSKEHHRLYQPLVARMNNSPYAGTRKFAVKCRTNLQICPTPA